MCIRSGIQVVTSSALCRRSHLSSPPVSHLSVLSKALRLSSVTTIRLTISPVNIEGQSRLLVPLESNDAHDVSPALYPPFGQGQCRDDALKELLCTIIAQPVAIHELICSR